MRIRHQAKKSSGREKANNGLLEFQMIICGQTEDLKGNDTQMMMEFLALTRSQNGTILLDTSLEEKEDVHLD